MAKAKAEKLTGRSKLMISVWMTLMFIIVASPWLFKLVNGLFESISLPSIANSDGCANLTGLVLHGVVFGILVRLMMEFRLPGV